MARGWVRPERKDPTNTGGAVMATMVFKLLPEFERCSMSMPKTRLRTYPTHVPQARSREILIYAFHRKALNS